MSNAASQVREQGYAILSSPELRQSVENVRKEISSLIKSTVGISEVTLEQSIISLFSLGDQDQYLSIIRSLPKLRSVRALIYDRVAEELIRVGLNYTSPMELSVPVVHLQGEKVRIPGGYFGTKPHQDITAFGEVPSLLTFWVPLTDVKVNDHPLELIPGSHDWGVLDFEPDNQVNLIVDDRVVEDAYVSVPASRGEAIVFSGHTVHRSGSGSPDTIRLAISYRICEAANQEFCARRYEYLDNGAPKK